MADGLGIHVDAELAAWPAGPPSPFDKLRVRTTFNFGSVENLILSLSKDEVFSSSA
jgi:hypothetical protein